jgi:hypothetical protein
MIFDIMSTGQNGKHFSLKHCGVPPKGETEPPFHRLPIHPGPGPKPPHLGPICKPDVPLDTGRSQVPVVQSSLVNAVTLYLGSKL